MYNRQLINLIDHPEWQYIYYGLREKYPQINEKTKIVIEHYHTIYFPDPNPEINVLPTWTKYESWDEWKRSFFIHNSYIDDPDKRWRYSKKVVSNLLRIPTLIFAWMTGRMRKDIPMSVPLPSYRKVHMQRFGISDQGNNYSFYAHYEPCDDVFYFYGDI